MVDTGHQQAFEGMAVWPVANVVQQYGYLRRGIFFIGDVNAFAAQFTKRYAHQVVRAQAVVQACMYRSRVYKACQRHLMYAPQPLIPGMADDLHHKRILQPDETINGVVYNFAFECHGSAKVRAVGCGMVPAFVCLSMACGRGWVESPRWGFLWLVFWLALHISYLVSVALTT